jgi:hypothetical protein
MSTKSELTALIRSVDALKATAERKVAIDTLNAEMESLRATLVSPSAFDTLQLASVP